MFILTLIQTLRKVLFTHSSQAAKIIFKKYNSYCITSPYKALQWLLTAFRVKFNNQTLDLGLHEPERSVPASLSSLILHQFPPQCVSVSSKHQLLLAPEL